MSIVSNTFAMLFNTRQASNAEAGMMNTAERIKRRAANAPAFGSNPAAARAAHEAEKNDMSKMQMLGLTRKISMAMEESAKKMAKENAKSFDFYA